MYAHHRDKCASTSGSISRLCTELSSTATHTTATTTCVLKLKRSEPHTVMYACFDFMHLTTHYQKQNSLLQLTKNNNNFRLHAGIGSLSSISKLYINDPHFALSMKETRVFDWV